MSFNKKLPVFFHIPKNAGTYTNNRCFSFMQRFAAGKKHYHVDVYKDGVIYYRFICYSEHPLNEKFEQLHHKTLYKINLKDLSFDGLFIFMLRIADSGFSNYKKDLYPLLDKDIEPCEFLFLRDPYSRLQSLYSYIESEQSSHETSNKSIGCSSFIDYINSPKLEGSWLIRSLLNISNELPITDKHFKKCCKILDHFKISDVEDCQKTLEEVFYYCYSFDVSNIDSNVYRHKTKNKTDIPYTSLDKAARINFNNQTKWDRLLYEKFANKKIIDEKQKRGKIINCFYEGSNGGFGDFLRGSVNLFNHCMSKGFDFDIDINRHKISKHFKHKNSQYENFNIDDLALNLQNTKHFIHALKRHTEKCILTTKPEETKYIFSNYHPCLTDSKDIINYLNLMPPINNRCCAFLQDKLQFSDEINDSVYRKLKEENLKTSKFNIIHFRLGDQNSFSDHGENLEDLYKDCLLKCFLKLSEDDKPIIVLSDSNDLKKYLKEKSKILPIYILHLESNHMQKNPSGFSGEIKTTDDGVFYAVFDMKLITLANSVESHSVYKHGSGFVYWIAKIFGVPVKLNLINA